MWISTFTKNLQHQIWSELDRLYPDPAAKARRVVIRKGRENYLCLLNYEEAVAACRCGPTTPFALGMMARWIAASREGDMIGGDFPGWLPDLIGRSALVRPHRPARRVHPFRLHPLSQMLHRKERARARGALASSSPTMRW